VCHEPRTFMFQSRGYVPQRRHWSGARPTIVRKVSIQDDGAGRTLRWNQQQSKGLARAAGHISVGYTWVQMVNVCVSVLTPTLLWMPCRRSMRGSDWMLFFYRLVVVTLFSAGSARDTANAAARVFPCSKC
jgi:hypothetical protein